MENSPTKCKNSKKKKKKQLKIINGSYWIFVLKKNYIVSLNYNQGMMLNNWMT